MILEATKLKVPQISLCKASDLNQERIESFREAISDFCTRSGSPAHPLSVWFLVQGILTGKVSGEIWAYWEGNKILGYFINEIRQDLDGRWTCFILHGWADAERPIKEHLEQFDTVIAASIKKGVNRVQFLTRRNKLVFMRWMKNRFTPVGTLFELGR